MCRQCGKHRKQQSKRGYQNLLEHLNRFHPDWKEIMSTEGSSSHGSRSILANFVDSKSSSIYGWIEWIVARNLPFNFCEDEITRKNVNLKPISVETLKKYMELLWMEVELKIKEILQEKFAIIFDGWSEDSTHFLGIYAKDPKGQYLLAFTPLYDETDLSAESQSALIFDTLELYGKDVSNFICLIGDNCNINKSVAKKLGVPFIGC